MSKAADVCQPASIAPALADDSLVEADTPYPVWLRNAAGGTAIFCRGCSGALKQHT